MSLGVRATVGDLRRLVAAALDIERVQADAQAVADDLAATTGIVDYLEVLTGDAFDVEPERALLYFRAKGLRASFSYADMIGEAHDHAFTVAKMMDVDMLAQVRASLDSALANGTSFKSWATELEPILKAGGWWGEREMIDPLTGQTVRAQLGSPWRLETIFRTNAQIAYSAQAWAEIEAQADLAPFLMYDAVDDHRTREQHRRWDRKVMLWSDPWWRTHYPPNGWNCRCGAIQLSADQLADMGLSPTPAPEDGTYKWLNPRTDVTHRVPDGLDPGFDRNPGQTYLADAMRLLEERVGQLPQDMRAAAQEGMIPGRALSPIGEASAMVVDLAGDVKTAAKLNSLISGPVIGYIEARIIGATPTTTERDAFSRLSSADQAEIERRISIGA